MSLQADLEALKKGEEDYQAKRKAKLAEEKRKRDREAKDHRRKLAAKQEKLYAEYAKQVIPIMGALCKRDGVDYTTMSPDQVMATPTKTSDDGVDYKAIVEALGRRDAVDYTGLQLGAIERGEQVGVEEDRTAGLIVDDFDKIFFNGAVGAGLRTAYTSQPEEYHKLYKVLYDYVHGKRSDAEQAPER